MATVLPITLTYNRLYLVETGGVRVLIDAGPDYEGAWEALQDQLGGRTPDVVVVTHAHSDHAGLGRQWQEAGVPVLLHREDVRAAASYPLQDDGELAGYASYLETCGAPPELRDEAYAALLQRRQWARGAATRAQHPPPRPGGRWPSGLRMPPFHADSDAHVTLDRSGIDVLHCPGHTPGNVVLLHRDRGWLFSGDQLLPNITPTPGIQMVPGKAGGSWNRFRSLPSYVDSLRGLLSLPLRHCYPGHGEEIADPLALVAANLAAIEERSERVLTTVNSHAAATAFALAEALYPRALGRRFWQIIATIQGNLDLLEDARLVRQEGDGVYFAI